MFLKNQHSEISRRAALGGLAAGLLGLRAEATTATRIDRSRVSAITDEIARSPIGAIEFAQKYGIQWLELRSVPDNKKQEYFQLSEAGLKQAAREFRDGGVKISFLNTSMFKYWLPGTEPERSNVRRDPKRFEQRKEELKQAAQAAHILGTDKVRVFAFMRVKNREEVMPRVADHLNELAELAGREKIRLLIENEGACNVASSAETAELAKHVPSKWVGINWDPLNSAHAHEVAYPDGYEVLPTKRIWNVQIKGKSILPGPELLDWKAIFRRLDKDGYTGQVGLETHIFGEVQVRKSHESMVEILRILG